jgi:hypothetical protein
MWIDNNTLICESAFKRVDLVKFPSLEVIKSIDIKEIGHFESFLKFKDKLIFGG